MLIQVPLRTRNETKWSFTHHVSLRHYLESSINTGAHSIAHRGQSLDLLVLNHGSPVTLVYFHGAVSSKVTEYPFFSGRLLSKRAGVNLIAASDPALGMGNVSLGWHLGNARIGPLRPALSQAIHHTANQMKSDRTILFGASGGGHPALHYSRDFPDSTVLLVNPRISLVRPPWPTTAQYLRICHYRDGLRLPSEADLRFLKKFGPIDAGNMDKERLNSKILLYQNLGDTSFLQGQTLPFLKKNMNNPDVYVRFSHDGAGHKVIPSQVIRQIVNELAKCQEIEDGIREAKFERITRSLSI